SKLKISITLHGSGIDAHVLGSIALTELDFENAELLTKDELYNPNALSLEEVNKHRSDIRGPVASRKRFRRNGINKPAKLWPGGKIPYSISPHYTNLERALLARAIKQYHDKTCLRFVPRSLYEGDYLFIGKVDGCFSEVGRTNGVQVLSLDDGCLEYTTIIHEMMHVIGFYHEHERWDRDDYINIFWKNIDRTAIDQFGKVDLTKTSYYGQPYDYRSILHYDSLAFSKNGFPTMLPKQKGFATTIGNAKDFSEIDLAKINRMYGCPEAYIASLQPRAQSSMIYSPLLKRHEVSAVDDQYFDKFSTEMENKNCKDRIAACWMTQDRCHSQALFILMKTLCAKTCKLC
uniref:Metalloendopeptidase n=1 Tax=Elaeophora elaphi TaxID=1147741 RepID=A0A0R3RHF0_9BILA